MLVKSKLRHLRIAPRKVRLVADLVRGKKVEDAQLQLKFSKKQAAKPLLKLLNSGVSNAENNFGLSKSTLVIKHISVDEGPRLKRLMPRAQGRGDIILKRSSHVNLILEGEKAERQKNIEPKKELQKEERKLPQEEKEVEEMEAARKSGFFKKVLRKK